MCQKKIIHFSDPGLFAQLEDQAIDGVLDYSEFPLEEYRYFSKLSRQNLAALAGRDDARLAA